MREQRQRFLADAAKVLGTSLDLEDLLARIAALAVPELADWCTIELLEAGRLRTVAAQHREPEKLEIVRQLRREHPIGPDSRTGVAAVLRSAHAALYLDAPADAVVEPGTSTPELVNELAPNAVIVAPFTVHERVIGALTLVAEGSRSFDADDLAHAEEFVRHAAIALNNARLLAEQQQARADAEEARARTARLQAVTDALAETMTSTGVADVLMREGLVALRAQAGAVLGVGGNGETLEILGVAGYPAELTQHWVTSGISTDSPAAEAVRARELVAVESAEELVARWPHLADAQRLSGDCASLTAPLIVADQIVGVLHMAYRQPRLLDEADRSFAQGLARQCAHSLERARRYEEEQKAREQAERLAGNLRRLQTIIDATFMTGSLDELLRELLIRLRDAIESDTATILTVDETGEALVVRDAIGFEESIQTRVPIGEGFAGGIAATKAHQVVDDISKIHVVSPYLRTSGLKSLAGVPLVADGRLVGVAHVGTKRMRQFDRDDVLLLRLVAARAAIAIDRTQVHEREHHAAEVFQRSLLPERLPAIADVEIAARYVPGTIGYTVGGDWYDVFELEDGSIGLAVGDVVGHGVPAAATMGRLRTLLRAYASEGFGPGDALGRLNKLACEGGDETFATVVYAVIAPSRTRLRLATAGHPPVLLRQLDRTVDAVEGGRSLPIGAAEGTSYPEVELRIDPGITLVLYTDGLVERRAESIDSGIERLIALLESTPGSLDRLADRIVEELESSDHTDDVALLAVQLEPVTMPKLSLRFPAEPHALAPMRSSLRAWLEGHGARDEEIFDILVAVNEACSNAIEHPLGRSRPDVTLDAEFADGAISIVIQDYGRWRPARPHSDRGRGLEFMGALMESVDVERSGDGTAIHLTRRLERSPK